MFPAFSPLLPKSKMPMFRAETPFTPPDQVFNRENREPLSPLRGRRLEDVLRGAGTENDPIVVDTPDTAATLDTTGSDEPVMEDDDPVGDYDTMERVEDDLDAIIRSLLFAVDTLVDARRYAKGEFPSATAQRYHVSRALRSAIEDFELCTRQIGEIDDSVVGPSSFAAWQHVYGETEPVAEPQKFNTY
jgi:hypothetical protein